MPVGSAQAQGIVSWIGSIAVSPALEHSPNDSSIYVI
jgi:hypothetical protein|tara:strand:- start:1567 stop:1677 length:111 start_codon:yes stop_codon:yes gene_type:complete